MDKRPYNYRFTPIAEDDINGIFDYIAFELSSPRAAENLINKIQAAVESVCEFPFSRPLLNSEGLKEKDYRLIVVENFNLFYTVKDETIVIMRVMYGRRNYNGLL